MLKLMKDCVHFFPEPLEDQVCAESLRSNGGLTRRARKRKLVIDREMRAVLETLIGRSRCDFVFTSPQDSAESLPPWVLEAQITRVRKKITTHPDAGLHGAASHFSDRGR